MYLALIVATIVLSLILADGRPASARVATPVPRETLPLAGPSGLVEVQTVSTGTGRYVSLRTLAKAFGGSVRVGERQGILKAKNLVVTVERGRPRALIEGRAFPLPGLPRFRAGDILLPVRGSSIGILDVPPSALEATRAVKPSEDGTAIVPEVGRIRFWGHPEYTRVVIETSGPVRYMLAGLDAPVVRLEIEARAPSHAWNPVIIRNGVIEELVPSDKAHGMFGLAIRRIDPSGRVRAFALRSPDRVVVDIFRSENLRAHAGESRRQDGVKLPDGIRVVVLDPGHGGRDWGAVGPHGLKEKDVVLDIALRLRRLLERLGIRVVLTRSDDGFIPLEERTAIANRVKGDLFLSLHVNADPRGKGEGFEAYFLTRDPSDSEARASALRENVVLPADGLSATEQDGVKPILWDITESLHVRESSALADAVLDQLERALGVRNRGIKSGPFAVLRHAAMPSVLVEVAFLTNPVEEARLQGEAHRQQLAQALLSGVARYKVRYERRLGLPASAAVPSS